VYRGEKGEYGCEMDVYAPQCMMYRARVEGERERERGRGVGEGSGKGGKEEREKERERSEGKREVGERSGVTFLIVSRPVAFCFGVYAS
jgi:hypothetical protein